MGESRQLAHAEKSRPSVQETQKKSSEGGGKGSQAFARSPERGRWRLKEEKTAYVKRPEGGAISVKNNGQATHKKCITPA